MDPNNNDDSIFQNESIFQSAKNMEDRMSYPSNLPASGNQTGGLFHKLVKTVTNKINEYDTQWATKKAQDQVKNAFGPEEETIKLMMKLGCKLQYVDKTKIIVHLDKYNLHGAINPEIEGPDAYDDDAKKILRLLYDMKTSSESMESCLDRLEAEGFYPVGELEKTTVKYNGEDCNALIGTFQNKFGEKRQVYFYKGREITPDE